MSRLHKPFRTVAVAALLLGAAAAAAPPRHDSLTLEQWSKLVWESARRGDRGVLDTCLSELPREPVGDNVRRLHQVVTRYNDNQVEALAARDESRADAHRRMSDHLGSGGVGQALTAAVEVQTLSEDRAAVFADPEVGDVVSRARAEIPKARRDGDWLYAYELLFRLNVLFEHTGEFEKELNRVNRRLALLSYYAPRRLHELRKLQAERLGEEPLGDFNNELVEDYKQRLEDMEAPMVRAALTRAAQEHIEGWGWRPLFVGGLEGLRMLGTTPALAESFPGLRDSARTYEFVDYIDLQRERIDQAEDGELGYRLCNEVLGDLTEVAERTVGLPAEVVLREFGDGAMHELDEFSEVVWPDKYHRFRQSTQGSFSGVGIVIRFDEKREILVVSPLEGTPAYHAGIKPGDRIAQVDGVPTAGWSLNDAVDRITGKKGTQVTLGIRREGEPDLRHLPIVRDEIKIHSVKGWWKTGLDQAGRPAWDWYIDPDTRIAYIRLSAFNEDTYEDLKSAWRDILAAGVPNGLILDLRYNPGGLLVAAVDVANLFIRNGVIVSGETRDGEEAWPDRVAEANKAFVADSGVSTVVLVNEGSASASEIVAGCLQAHGAAVVVGMRTFGKGSVQTVHQISRKALLKLTTQYYRLPPTAEQEALEQKGRLVHRRPGAKDWGVVPDIEVNPTPQQIKAAYELRQAADILAQEGDPAKPAERPEVTDLIAKGIDPQLETALLILQAKALGTSPADTRHARAD